MGKGSKNRRRNQKKDHSHDSNKYVGEEEERFTAAETRPQFRQIPKNQSKVVLDERFSSVLTDPRFQLEGKDKYGRRQSKKKKDDAKEELSVFYSLKSDDNKATDEKVEDDDASSTSEEDATESKKSSRQKEKEGEMEDPASRIAYLTAFSRGEIQGSSPSSESDESSESSDEDDKDADEEDPVHGTVGVLDPSNQDDENDVELSYEDSPYLVVTNMDWDHIKAVDLFAILSSFSPPGTVKRVGVYKSDFGMERMEKDVVSGPANIWKPTRSDADSRNDDIDDNSSAASDNGSNEDSLENDSDSEGGNIELKVKNDHVESDFDPEKLRAYEASKMKYFFAVAEFAESEHANVAYQEVDGMEFEHSSSAIDLRTIPAEEVEGVTIDRPLRDVATSIPSNYVPPDFIVSALQQTSVQCTWDQGDVERERQLTKYGSTGWGDVEDDNGLQVYLASDASSDEASEDEKAEKGAKTRKLLGLDSDDDDDQDSQSSKDDESTGGISSSEDESMAKEMKFIPGQTDLKERIKNKLQSKHDEESETLTPWEKYKEKRRLKRKERRDASRNKSRETGTNQAEGASESESNQDDDDFLVNEKKNGAKESSASKKTLKYSQEEEARSTEALELMFSGENAEENERDFDIRGIQRLDKHKNKKLRGARKRKEDKLASDVAGREFKLDVADDRFAAVLEGNDSRFGIDKTDSNYKETPAMREILAEQTKRRKKKRQRVTSNTVVPDVVADKSGARSAGSTALSSLVKRLKSKVSKTQ